MDKEELERSTKENYEQVRRYLISYHHIKPSDADDITQNIFYTFIKKSDKLNFENGNVISWLMSAARNIAKQYYAELKKHNNEVSLDELITADTYEATVEALIENAPETQDERCAAIISQLKKHLSKGEREVAECVFEKELNYIETAEELNITYGNVRKRMTGIRKKARKNRAEIMKA